MTRVEIRAACVTVCCLAALAWGQLVDSSFVYQGRLTDAGQPANGSYDFEFSLFDAESGGIEVGSAGPFLSQSVTGGLFTVTLDFGDGVFTGEQRYLEMRVRAAGGGAYTTLAPRTRVTAAPYARAMPGVRTGNIGGQPNVVGGDLTNTASGASASTIAGGRFNEIRVGIQNTIGGGTSNVMDLAANGSATIAGGEQNQIDRTGGFIGGGDENHIADGAWSVISGGGQNVLYDGYSAIGGGQFNVCGVDDGDEVAQAVATVGGGLRNEATGFGSTIPGGSDNTASGAYSTALGRQANAAHDGAFVWADSAGVDYTSTAANQFLIRAAGGVGINTNAPDVTLHVTGGTDTGITGGGYIQLGNTNGANVSIDENEIIARNNALASPLFLQQDGGDVIIGGNSSGNTAVGIGRNTPQWALHVADTQGVIRLDSTNNTNGSVLELRNETSATDETVGAINFVDSGGSTNGQILYQDDEFIDYMTFRVGGTEKVRFEGDGSVGIGTNNPGAFLLAVNGSAAKPGGGSWSSFSDERLKTNIADLDGALDRLLQLRGRTFEYADPEHMSYVPGQQMGFIAQEVEESFPQWVGENSDGYKTVTVTGFEALTVEGVRALRQEQADAVAELRAEIEALRQDNRELRQLVEQLVQYKTVD